MSDLYDASESPLVVTHRHLVETDPLYRISLLAAPIALAVAVVAGAVWLAWPGTPPLPPPAAPAAPSSPAAPPRPPSGAGPSASAPLSTLRDRAVGDFGALVDLRKQADAGNAEAEFYMGTLFDPTLTQLPFANKDKSTSFDWYRKAAEQGFAVAELTLGQSYQIGWGVARNDTTAAQWFRKAAMQGVPLAQYQIGLMTARGQGIQKDCKVAKTWLEDAKTAGIKDAASSLSSGAAGACQW